MATVSGPLRKVLQSKAIRKGKENSQLASLIRGGKLGRQLQNSEAFFPKTAPALLLNYWRCDKIASPTAT